MACHDLLNVPIEAIQEDAPSLTYVFSIPSFFSNLTRSIKTFQTLSVFSVSRK